MCESVSCHIPSHELLYERLVIKIRSIFPTNINEINLVKFIGRYQYISNNDVQYFFNNTYYPKRIKRLVDNNILRRYNRYLVLGDNGYNFIKVLGENAVQLKYDKKYADRLKYISHIAAIYNNEKHITFLPSFEIKDKTAFTESSRKYIGILKMFGTSYLTYHISDEHTTKYINSIYYDLQRETQYKNIIILINNINRIDLKEWAFGLNSVVICEDNDKDLQELKYLQQVKWSKVIHKLYKNSVHLSEYNFCDYTDKKKKFISTFSFVDSEKLNKIDTFLKNNTEKQVDIICSENTFNILR